MGNVGSPRLAPHTCKGDLLPSTKTASSLGGRVKGSEGGMGHASLPTLPRSARVAQSWNPHRVPLFSGSGRVSTCRGLVMLGVMKNASGMPRSGTRRRRQDWKLCQCHSEQQQPWAWAGRAVSVRPVNTPLQFLCCWHRRSIPCLSLSVSISEHSTKTSAGPPPGPMLSWTGLGHSSWQMALCSQTV